MHNDGRPSALVYLWLLATPLVGWFFAWFSPFNDGTVFIGSATGVLIYLGAIVLYEIRAWGKSLLRAIEVYTEDNK